jgi:hypothetical protein
MKNNLAPKKAGPDNNFNMEGIILPVAIWYYMDFPLI